MAKEIEHINHALVAKPHPTMYLMHKFWARKPHNVVRKYIEHYSEEGEIVLDPFCGSGVTAIEAIKAGRKAIAIDLNPIATFITKMTATSPNLDKLEQIFNEIKDRARSEIDSLYETDCAKCGHKGTITHTFWQYDNDNETPYEIWYECKHCKNAKKKFLKKSPTDLDLAKLKDIKEMKIPYWYPRGKLRYPNGVEFKEGTHLPEVDRVSDLFTKRNLTALSILWHEIDALSNGADKELMKFVFSASLPQVSKMIRAEAKLGGWTVHRYWIPSKYLERNVWTSFETRYKKIKAGIQIIKEEISQCKEAKSFDDLTDDADILVKTHNAMELMEMIPPNSVDYVFTDPPYGGTIQYFELSTMWTSWLIHNNPEFELNYDDEITINQQQRKDFEYYHKMLAAAFRETWKVLKPGRYMTVTFHSTSIKIWNSIIRAVLFAGFELERIVYQPPSTEETFNRTLNPYGTATGDYYIRFKKPEAELLPTTAEIDEERYEKIVIDSAKRIIAERGEPTPYQFILNGIYLELQKAGALLGGRKDVDTIMKTRLNKDFVLNEVKDHKGKVVGHLWWFKDPTHIAYLERIPLSERIERAVIDVLNRKITASFDDILQEIFIKFPNALTPPTHNIREVLEDYAEKTKEGKWRLRRTLKEVRDRHTRSVYYLAVLGKKAGYSTWVGLREQGNVYKNQKLSELCDESEPSLRFIPSENMDRIKQIDIIWYKDGEITYEFEVENTTGVTSAIVRGANIPYPGVKRIIVIPEEREKLLQKRVKEPLLEESIKKDDWKFIFIKDLEAFYNMNKRKKTIDARELQRIERMPKSRSVIQRNLVEYT